MNGVERNLPSMIRNEGVRLNDQTILEISFGCFE